MQMTAGTWSPGIVLERIPEGLRRPLIEAYTAILTNFRESRWEPSELNGGKLCEVVYAILDGAVRGKFAAKPRKPPNLVDACLQLQRLDQSAANRSVRIQIPRMLVALYEVRNNRGVGHVGGDVDPNRMDAMLVVSMSQWIMAELVRIFHDVDPESASNAVEALVERKLPVIWEVGSMKRVLDPSLSMKDKTLALLYSTASPVPEADLIRWAEHSNASVYRRDILVKAHKSRLIEYDARRRTAQLSPLGIRYVEDRLNLAV